MPAMHPPRMLRSLTFWGGLLVIAFICWAWWDSSWRWVHQRAGHNIIFSEDSGLEFFHCPSSEFGWKGGVSTDLPWQFGSRKARPRLARPGFAHSPGEEIPEAEVAYLAGTRRLAERLGCKSPDPIVADFYNTFYLPTFGRHAWMIFIPYWCVLAAVLVLWLALIYGRHRRIKRHLASGEPASGAAP